MSYIPPDLSNPITLGWATNTKRPLTLTNGQPQEMPDQDWVALADVATSGAYSDLTGTPDLSAYEPVRADPVYPDSVTVDAGTLIGGTASDLGSINETYVQVQEASGADPLTVRLTFTGVTEFNQIAIEGRYEGSAAHELAVEIYHVANELYALVGYVSDMDADAWMEFAVPHPADYIDGSGTVVVRLRHVQSGVTSHNLYLDYAALRDAASGGGVTSHPGLTGRSVADAHPISAITGLQTSLDNAIPKPSTGLTEQTTLADSDQFAIQESGGTVKKTLWSTIKSAITALLGTAAFKNTGTSGNTVPLLDGANTWSTHQYVSGNVGIGTTTPAAKLDVNGYSKLGESAPNIKCKRLTFNTGAVGTITGVLHGVTGSKILYADGYIIDSNGSSRPTRYGGGVVEWFVSDWQATTLNVYIGPDATLLASRPGVVLVWYEE